MSKVNVYLADGCEEVEALTVVDILRRGGVDTDMVSITGKKEITSSHKVTFLADKLFEQQDTPDVIVLPGGIPGTPNLKAHAGLAELIKKHNAEGKLLAAICAAPTVYGEMGLLEGKKATCYPGMEDELIDAKVCTDSVSVDGRFITSRGLGTAIDFALTLTAILAGQEKADALATKIVYR